MTPCSILCILVMLLKHLNRSQHNIDSTQPRGWYVPITLRMQRSHHLLGGGEYCYESAQLYLTVCSKHTAPSSTRIKCWGSPLCILGLVSALILFCRGFLYFFSSPFPKTSSSNYSNPNLIESIYKFLTDPHGPGV